MPHHRQVHDQSFDNLDLEGAVEMLANLTVTQREKRAEDPPAQSPFGEVGNTIQRNAVDPLTNLQTGAGVPPDVAKYLSYGLLGAGVGGAAGVGSELLSSKKKKRPLSALLQGGLLGGALGGGGSMIYNNWDKLFGPGEKPPTRPDASPTFAGEVARHGVNFARAATVGAPGDPGMFASQSPHGHWQYGWSPTGNTIHDALLPTIGTDIAGNVARRLRYGQEGNFGRGRSPYVNDLVQGLDSGSPNVHSILGTDYDAIHAVGRDPTLGRHGLSELMQGRPVTTAGGQLEPNALQGLLSHGEARTRAGNMSVPETIAAIRQRMSTEKSNEGFRRLLGGNTPLDDQILEAAVNAARDTGVRNRVQLPGGPDIDIPGLRSELAHPNFHTHVNNPSTWSAMHGYNPAIPQLNVPTGPMAPAAAVAMTSSIASLPPATLSQHLPANIVTALATNPEPTKATITSVLTTGVAQNVPGSTVRVTADMLHRAAGAGFRSRSLPGMARTLLTNPVGGGMLSAAPAAPGASRMARFGRGAANLAQSRLAAYGVPAALGYLMTENRGVHPGEFITRSATQGR